jgi:hypothetical protein
VVSTVGWGGRWLDFSRFLRSLSSAVTRAFTACINSYMSAGLGRRCAYCERGYIKVECNLPGIDYQEASPRSTSSAMRQSRRQSFFWLAALAPASISKGG